MWSYQKIREHWTVARIFAKQRPRPHYFTTHCSKMLQGVRRTFGRDITNNANVANGKESGAPLAKKPTTSTSFFSAPLASLGMTTAAVPAPMVRQATEGTTETQYDDEMDMESKVHMQRPADDIDSRDMGNPLLCTVYVNEMYNLFFDQERQMAAANASNYMPNQPHINEKMRCILVDWMIEVHLKFKMVPETLYLTVNLIDRYLQLKTVRRSKLQLVGVACLMVRSPSLFSTVTNDSRNRNDKNSLKTLHSDVSFLPPCYPASAHPTTRPPSPPSPSPSPSPSTHHPAGQQV